MSGIDVSGLPDGTLTLSLTLTDAAGNVGAAATDTVVEAIIPTNNLVHYWSFEEGAGTTLTDSVGGNTGNLVNMEAGDWVAGKFGTALNFDGVDEGVVTSINSLSPTQGAMTAWTRPNLVNPPVLERIIMGSREPNRLYLSRETNGNLAIRISGVATTDTGANVPAGAWSHVAMVWDNGTYWVYLDGAQVLTGAYGAMGGLSDCPQIGLYNDVCGSYGSPDGFLNGQIDEVRMYSAALTSAQIAAIAAGAP